MSNLSDGKKHINEKRELARTVSEKISANPRFEGMNPLFISFSPIDGDNDRMKIYGCYKGDKFTYLGKTYEVEQDDVPHMTLQSVKDVDGLTDNENRRRLYAGDVRDGDTVTVGAFQCSYWGEDGGWTIKCIDWKTPMQNVVMPEEVLGKPVTSAEHCFCDCYNVASVAHISSGVIASGRVLHMFNHSGLRVVPTDLYSDKSRAMQLIQMSCGRALAIQNYTEMHDAAAQLPQYNHSYWGKGYIFSLQNDIVELKQRKQDMRDALVGDLPRYAAAQRVKFIYKGELVTTYRVREDFDDHRGQKWHGVNQSFQNGVNVHKDATWAGYLRTQFPVYEQGKREAGLPDLSIDSFEDITLDEFANVVDEMFDKAICNIEKFIGNAEERSIKEIEIATKKADNAQVEFTGQELQEIPPEPEVMFVFDPNKGMIPLEDILDGKEEL